MKQQQTESKVKTLEGAFFRPDAFKQKKVELKILETRIANTLFEYGSEDEIQEYSDKYPAGTEVFLYRDADNLYDKWAVEITDDQKEVIGYVSAFKNETVARLLDAGKKITAFILDESETENGEYGAPTEKGLPIAVYMEDQ